MIRVRVLCPGFCDFSRIGPDGMMELPDGATLDEVLDHLRLSFLMRRLLAVRVNGVKASPRTTLKDGDTVSVLSGLSGG